MTARFKLGYVFVVLEVGTPRLLHWNLTNIRRLHGPFSNFS